MPAKPTLTPAAQRSLDRAARLAAAAGASRAETLHLLWALCLEDAEAAEILLTLGVSAQTLANSCPLDSLDPRVSDTPADVPPAATHELQQALVTSHQIGVSGRHAELTSAHLLVALCGLDMTLLQRCGVDEGDVRRLVEPPEAGGTIAVEEEFRIGDVRSEVPQTSPTVPWPPPASSPDTRPAADVRSSETDDRVSSADNICRVLDAAANRAREGLRVVEDYTRFILNDRLLTQELKTCRHELTAILADIPHENLLKMRDTPGDVGTDVTTPAELHRVSADAVVQANLKRAQEALRTIEEFGKVEYPRIAGRVEQLRYRTYALEKAVTVTQRASERLANCRLYLLLTEAACTLEWESVATAAVAAGVGAIQLREKHLPDEEIVRRGRRLRQLCHDADTLFIMNDRPDLAVLTGADGVHVGQEELTVANVRRVVGPEMLVGLSTHDPAQARRAVLEGADYLGIGPVFPSETKDFDQLAGLRFVSHAAEDLSLPWFAIGGIDSTNQGDVRAAGATRMAVCGAVCGATDVEQAVRLLQPST